MNQSKEIRRAMVPASVAMYGYLFRRHLRRFLPSRPPVSTVAGVNGKPAELPEEGAAVTVETALNSRCTSDEDGRPHDFHWGEFDRDRRLSPDQVRRIVSLASGLPSAAPEAGVVEYDRELLRFVIDNGARGIARERMMVQSGMQQQAVALACAALGVGMVFRSLGPNGRRVSGGVWANTRIRLGAMKPPYCGSYWSAQAPGGLVPWRRGNLPDPDRTGRLPLVAALTDLELHATGKRFTEADAGQLLWAARGRTPHFYKSVPWGLTIPTAEGRQNITTVYRISEGILFRYVNWKGSRPTHSIEPEGKIGAVEWRRIAAAIAPYDQAIVIGRNQSAGRALWETGYQLLNLILEAEALGIAFQAMILGERRRASFQCAGITGAAAALFLQSGDRGG